MKNEEIALEKINDMIDDCNDCNYTKGIECDCIQYPCRLHIIKQVIQENTKLKAENERLHNQLQNEVNLENELLGDILRRDSEIKQLKAELEQSVKLPCTVGDVVYVVGRCKDFPPKLDGTMWDSDGGYGTATGYYCPYEYSDLCPFKDLEDCSFAENKLGVFEDIVCHICIEEDKTWYVCENSNGYEASDFGRTIFLTREEAEQSLKGKVKE